MAAQVLEREAVQMTPAQELLFAQLVETYWEEEKKKVEVHMDNLLFQYQVLAVQMGVM